MKKMELQCPHCGAPVDVVTDVDNPQKQRIHCSYCGYDSLLVEDKQEKEKVKLVKIEVVREKEEHRHLSKRASLFLLASLVLLVGAVYVVGELKKNIDPFAGFRPTFEGRDDFGTVSWFLGSNGVIRSNRIEYEVSPRDHLSNGDTVLVTATSNYYHLKKKEMQYEVNSLTEKLMKLKDLTSDALQQIRKGAAKKIQTQLQKLADKNLKADFQPDRLVLRYQKKKPSNLYEIGKATFTLPDGSRSSTYLVAGFSSVYWYDYKKTHLTWSTGTPLGTPQPLKNQAGQVVAYIDGFPSAEAAQEFIRTFHSSKQEDVRSLLK